MRNFQGYFSRTFQVLEFLRKKSRTFQEAWEPCVSFTFIIIKWKSHKINESINQYKQTNENVLPQTTKKSRAV